MNELIARLSMKAAIRILEDLGDRSGIGDELDQIDAETLTEIMAEIAGTFSRFARELLQEIGE